MRSQVLGRVACLGKDLANLSAEFSGADGAWAL